MSQRNRRFLAVVGLAAALTLALPAPSRAVGFRAAQAPALAARVWAWLEGLGLLPRRPAVPARQPTNAREKQGSAIDPNGRTVRIFFTFTTNPDASSEQGSAIDPNGGG